jgi:hypothetical protein
MKLLLDSMENSGIIEIYHKPGDYHKNYNSVQ